MTVWKTPIGYTGGEVVLYWTGDEMLELRMVDDTLATAVSAAENLKARFFFKVIGRDVVANLPVWGAFDRRTVERSQARITVAPPTKTFTTEDLSPLIMWAAAKGNF